MVQVSVLSNKADSITSGSTQHTAIIQADWGESLFHNADLLYKHIPYKAKFCSTKNFHKHRKFLQNKIFIIKKNVKKCLQMLS